MKHRNKKWRIGIVGAGRVGSALARALSRRQLGPEVIISKTRASSRRLAKETDCRIFGTDPTLLACCNIVIISVPDGTIKSVTAAFSKITFYSKLTIVAHTSGSRLSTEVNVINSTTTLIPTSMHPLQTFTSTRDRVDIIDGIFFALEGSPKGITILKKLATALGANSFVLGAQNKVLYHAGAVMASNFLVGLLYSVQALYRELGISDKATLERMLPIVRQTLSNVAKNGTYRALTGPAARRDIATIQRHQKAIRPVSRDPHRMYVAMTAICLTISDSKREAQ